MTFRKLIPCRGGDMGRADIDMWARRDSKGRLYVILSFRKDFLQTVGFEPGMRVDIFKGRLKDRDLMKVARPEDDESSGGWLIRRSAGNRTCIYIPGSVLGVRKESDERSEIKHQVEGADLILGMPSWIPREE